MKSLVQLIKEKYLTESKISEKATPLMKAIIEYFRNTRADSDLQKPAKQLYKLVKKECKSIEVPDKDISNHSLMIFMKSKNNKNKILEVIFTRPIKNQKHETYTTIDCVGFDGFVEGAFWSPMFIESVKGLKKYFKEYTSKHPIEMYEVEEKDAFSAFPKSLLRFQTPSEGYSHI